MTEPVNGGGPGAGVETQQKTVLHPCARPGNFGNTRNPYAVYWRRRALRKQDRWVLTLVRDYVPRLVADKGGDAAVSFAERKVMELAAVARVCWALAMVAGNLEAVARFVGVEAKCLADLGLERRAKSVDPMQALRDAVARSHSEAEAGRAAGEEEEP